MRWTTTSKKAHPWRRDVLRVGNLRLETCTHQSGDCVIEVSCVDRRWVHRTSLLGSWGTCTQEQVRALSYWYATQAPHDVAFYPSMHIQAQLMRQARPEALPPLIRHHYAGRSLVVFAGHQINITLLDDETAAWSVGRPVEAGEMISVRSGYEPRTSDAMRKAVDALAAQLTTDEQRAQLTAARPRLLPFERVADRRRSPPAQAIGWSR